MIQLNPETSIFAGLPDPGGCRRIPIRELHNLQAADHERGALARENAELRGLVERLITELLVYTPGNEYARASLLCLGCGRQYLTGPDIVVRFAHAAGCLVGAAIAKLGGAS